MTAERPKRTLAVIAARGGSKGIPLKNLLDL
jgi:CMP-N-acetylneuraminic acid synthetase